MEDNKIKNWLGKKVKVVMDRPLGSKHPDKKFDTIYPINYGFIPNTLSLADNEPIDAYVLGPTEPLKEFKGVVIAGILREDDGEIKLVVSDGQDYSREEIEKLTYFQEKYHKSGVYKLE
ncbi:MAG: inorganic diphosphatase [Patescibacteria group bacterium]|nr:inorganic diphosphatase [Patescibacteria group bacterium]MDD5120980.1 inorganic diphosphatase [Patescibacteria group bacterium]MDD5222262.1 inorganic diphosphatase [Patescibacteria group bacterium]MDD5396423.1 inorganic diphosphatase [Patescibacteria group bacterium]